jgi:branched-chain amino acid transport system ATP-binding protein
MSVYENLLLGAHWVRCRATEGERLAYVYELFPRLQERRGQLAGTLSGGERIMLAIGRALMSGPSLLMIDEPSLGLAPRVADSVFAALARLKSGGYSIMMVEQSVHAALEVADHVYFLERGEVAVEGPPAKVVTVERVQREYLGQRKP